MSYDIVIRVIGQDDASGPLGNVESALGRIGQFAVGGVLANAITGGLSMIGGAITNMAGDALQSVSNYERMTASLESLIAKEIKNASGVEKTVKVGQERLQLTEKEVAELAKLQDAIQSETLKRDISAARIQEQKERIRQLTEQYGENGLVVIKERAELALMEQAFEKSGGTIDKYGARIAELNAKNGKLVDVTQKVVEGQMSMTDALALAGPKAADLLQWTEKLSIQSPFNSDDITKALKLNMAYGMTVEESKAVTAALVDLGSGMGMTGADLQEVALAFGQIHKADNLYMQDVKQLTMRGIDVDSVLKKMGFSMDDIGKKSIDTKKFTELLAQSWRDDFGGAAERMTNTLPGLLSSLDEIKNLGLRDIFTGVFNAAKPALTGLVELATSPAFRAGLQNFGAQMGTALTQGIAFVKTNVLPVLTQVAGWFQNTGAPALQRFAALAGPVLQQAFGQGVAFLQGVVIPALLQFGGWIQTNLIPALMQFGNFLQANVLPVLVQFGTWLGGTILSAAQQLGAWLMSSLVPALVTMGETIATAALPVLAQMGGWIQGTLIPALQQFASWIGPILQQAFQWLGTFIVGTLLPALTQLIVWILSKGLPALGDLAGVIGGKLNEALAWLAGAWAGITDNFGKAVTFVADTTANMLALADAISSTVGAAFQWLNDTILRPLADTFNWLVGLAESFMEWLQKIADALANMQIPDFLQRHSPSPLEQALMYSNDHLKTMAGLLPGSLGALGGMHGPGSLGFAGAGAGFGGGGSTDARRTVVINGGVSVGSESAAREFWRLMREWENGIATDARLVG